MTPISMDNPFHSRPPLIEELAEMYGAQNLSHTVHVLTVDAASVNEPRSPGWLADAVVLAHRYHGHAHVTVVLDVRLGLVPEYVIAAADMLAGQRIGLVIQHGHWTTLDEAAPLPRALRQAVASLARPGLVWHPVRRELAYMLH